MAIASAGILTEFALAGIATLLWSLAPDGSFRSAMFYLATASWVLTLVVNASPFMRFDGYFILSDLLNFPNLHERSGSLARTWLRRTIGGLAQPWPEDLPGAQRNALIAFAVLTWTYRLAVFLGIALLVYMFFFKVLGILLMAVEVGWFIVRPVHAELKVWLGRRREISRPRQWMAGIAGACLLVFLLVPWRTGIHGDGIVRAERQHQVFSPRAGELQSLPQRRRVQEGELLFVLAAPDLDGGAQRAQVLAQARARELVGLSGQQDGEERRASLQSERDRLLAEAGVFTGEQSRMQLLAPFAGRLVDLDPHLQAGTWVQSRHLLATLIDPSSWIAEIYVAEEDIGRIRPGDAVKVYLGLRAMRGHVAQVDSSRTVVLPHPMLDSAAGGSIVTMPPGEDRAAERVARDGIFRVRIQLDEMPPREQMVLCSAVISGTSRSLMLGVLDHALSVLIRESGF